MPYMRKVMQSIDIMSMNLTKLAEYFKAKYNDKDSQLPNFEVNKILNYIGLYEEEGPVPLSEALQEYFAAHIIGLDFLKTAVSDYMTHIIDKDYNVVNVFVMALMVQDEDLIEKATLYFLSHFHEVINSEKFKSLIVHRGYLARFMIHSARVWMSSHSKLFFYLFNSIL